MNPLIQSEAQKPMLAVVWIGLVAAISAAGSLAFACAAPLAAIAAMASVAASRGEGSALVLAAWIFNQIIGFGVLGYPVDAGTLGWGLAIGAAALIGFFAAQSLPASFERKKLFAILAFVAAYLGNQSCLFVYGLLVGYDGPGFIAMIANEVLAINAVAYGVLLALYRLAVGISLVEAPLQDAVTSAS